MKIKAIGRCVTCKYESKIVEVTPTRNDEHPIAKQCKFAEIRFMDGKTSGCWFWKEGR
jgi:hypothetical protein